MPAKRLFDVVFSVMALLLLGWLFILIYLFSCIDTSSNALFLQERVGQHGKRFTIYKFKTIHPGTRKISLFGRFLRNSKLDELPQLLNVLAGNMSMVGPRPDVEGYYDLLEGDDRKILELKPGITGPASLKYSKEEQLLAVQENPQQYNDEVIFPDKLKINLIYQQKQSFWLDCKIIIYTIFRKHNFFE